MKVRIKFSKQGPVKFIGHLDMMRYFQKAIRRADIDIAYSTGFSPHQIMSFASPLSVGHESLGEYFDIELVREGSAESLSAEEKQRIEQEIVQNLNTAMAEGVHILDAAVLHEKEGNAMASVAAASYLVAFSPSLSLPDNWQEKLLDFYNRETIPVIKKTKKGEKELDLKEGIYELQIRNNQVYMLLDAGSGSNVKPGFVLETFFSEYETVLPEFPFRVCRLETYRRNSEEMLVPLIDHERKAYYNKAGANASCHAFSGSEAI